MGRFFCLKDDQTYIVDGVAGNSLRTLATPSMASRISSIMSAGQPCYVCSASVLNPDKIDNSAYLVRRLEAIEERSPQFGGWREITTEELYGLQFADHFRTSTRTTAGFSAELAVGVQGHPAWRAGLSFATDGILSFPLGFILAEIFDIRRFSRPPKFSLSPLRSYFRLTNVDMLRKIRATPDKCMKAMPLDRYRTSMAVACWAMLVDPEFCLGGQHDFLLGDADRWTQREYQHYHRHYERRGFSPDETELFATWRATQKLIDFFHFHFLLGVGVCDVFDPKMFFRTEYDRRCYEEHKKGTGHGL